MSSVEERSAVDRRIRGAKGDMGGDVGEEEKRFCIWRQRHNARSGGIALVMRTV